MLEIHILEAVLNGDLSGALSAGLGGLFEGAQNALNDLLNDKDPREEVKRELQDFVKRLYEDSVPAAGELDRVAQDIQELANDVKTFGSDVVSTIANTVQGALDSGQLPAQTDGDLGATHDIFTPKDSAVPSMPVGELPGMGSDAAGTPRDGGGGGDGGSSADGGGGGVHGTTPLGGSGPAPDAGGSPTQPPTASDLGVDPNSYIEYQPNQGQVQITYPDGTTETRPWPPK
jgi:hypothetical protein